MKTNNITTECGQHGAYRKCPKCGLNYITGDQTECMVCVSENKPYRGRYCKECGGKSGIFGLCRACHNLGKLSGNERTDAGKTRYILDKYGDENVYRATDYGNMFSGEKFDGYKGEDIIIFEEFRSQIKTEKMLNYLDVYAIELPSRFRNKWACYTKVFIVSNWKLHEQYKNIQTEHPETWKAFLRRIHKVYDFDVSRDQPTNKTFTGLRPLTAAEQEELPF